MISPKSQLTYKVGDLVRIRLDLKGGVNLQDLMATGIKEPHFQTLLGRMAKVVKGGNGTSDLELLIYGDGGPILSPYVWHSQWLWPANDCLVVGDRVLISGGCEGKVISIYHRPFPHYLSEYCVSVPADSSAHWYPASELWALPPLIPVLSKTSTIATVKPGEEE